MTGTETFLLCFNEFGICVLWLFVSLKICHVLRRGLLKSMCAMGIKMMHSANISQYLKLVLCVKQA